MYNGGTGGISLDDSSVVGQADCGEGRDVGGAERGTARCSIPFLDRLLFREKEGVLQRIVARGDALTSFTGLGFAAFIALGFAPAPPRPDILTTFTSGGGGGRDDMECLEGNVAEFGV